MTHDELLAKINDEIDNGLGLMAVAILGDALRAVVELHKPNMRGDCDVCTWVSGGGFVVYPCPTIRAIENTLL